MRVLITGEAGNLALGIMNSMVSRKELEIIRSPTMSSCSNHHNRLELDITNRPLLTREIIALKPDVVIHSAAIVNTDKCNNNQDHCIEVNLNGTRNVLEACAKIRTKLIYISTTATYDPKAGKPYTEYSRQKPKTLYGITKYAGELLVTGQNEVPWIIVRPCFIFGCPPYDHSSQLTRIAMHTLLKYHWPEKAGPTPLVTLDPEKMKDYMYIQDFGESICEILLKSPWYEIYNVSRETPMRMGDYFGILGEELNMALDMAWAPGADYMKHHVVSSQKLKTYTGWKPKIEISSGIHLMGVAAMEYINACKINKEVLLYK